MAQNMGQKNIDLLSLWRSMGNSGDLPVGWNGPGGDASGAGGSIADSIVRAIQLKPEDKAALEKLKVSNINYDQFQQQAMEELRPYYERLLKESNYDIDLAKQRLEEDYQTGRRYAKEDSTKELDTLLGQTAPMETRNTLDNLNQRGLLDSVIPNQKQDQMSVTLPSGENKAYQPVTTANFGGVAGSEVDRLRQSQASRQEAIERALKRSDEQAMLDRQRKNQDYETQRQRTTFNMGQEKAEKAATLGESKYNRAIQRAVTQKEEILQPYIQPYS